MKECFQGTQDIFDSAPITVADRNAEFPDVKKILQQERSASTDSVYRPVPGVLVTSTNRGSPAPYPEAVLAPVSSA